MDDELVVEDDDVEYVPEEENVLPFPGFAPNLIGMVEEEEREFTVTIPEDYPREQYAGKEVQFQVEALSVKEKSLPELDDDFAKSIGDGFDDLSALRSNIMESLTTQAEASARNQLEQQSLEALCEAAIVNASPILFERELEAMQSERDRMLRQQNLDLATYLRFMGKTPEEFRDEMRPNAERRLTGSLVMRKLAEVEEIEISDEDVQAETDRLLGISSDGEEQDNLDNLREFLGMDSTRDSIRSSLHNKAIMDRLTDITQGNLDSDEPSDTPSDDDTPDESETAPTSEEPADDSAADDVTNEQEETRD
jgi:trigger factor